MCSQRSKIPSLVDNIKAFKKQHPAINLDQFTSDANTMRHNGNLLIDRFVVCLTLYNIFTHCENMLKQTYLSLNLFKIYLIR